MAFWPVFILIVVYGACVGSFLNVVIYRLPAGQSLWWPGSRCPGCGHGLAWYDNLPVIGWLLLRGRCRYCRQAISIQYPAIEALTALLFGLITWCYYRTDLRPDFAEAGLTATWPILLAHLALAASLIAATLIDARYYIIPLGITWAAALIAMILLPLGALWDEAAMQVTFPVSRTGMGLAMGGLVGLALAVLLLRLKVLPLSFADLEGDPEQVESQQQADTATGPEHWPAHPHPRREVLKEGMFLAFPVVGAVVGWWLLRDAQVVHAATAGGLTGDEWDVFFAPPAEPVPGWMTPPVRVLGGAVLGYLMGGLLIWATRVLGTLGFGREAMGLGDVHLLAAIGAVLGPLDVVYVFFAAPFMGLAAALASNFSRILAGKLRVIPYGPYLALGAILVMLLRDPLMSLIDLRVLL